MSPLEIVNGYKNYGGLCFFYCKSVKFLKLIEKARNVSCNCVFSSVFLNHTCRGMKYLAIKTLVSMISGYVNLI